MPENQDLQQHGGAAPDPVQPIKFEAGSPVVDSLRVRYPGLEHLDDQTFTRGIRKKFFPNLTEQQFLRGMSRKFGEKPEPGFFERFGNKVLNATKIGRGLSTGVRGAQFTAESGALGKIGTRLKGGEAPSFDIPKGSPAANILSTGLGVFKGATDFGKGVADALVGVDTPESRLAKDMLKELEMDARYTQNYIMGPFAALDLAARGDMESANRIMNDVHQEYGPRGLATLISLPADIAAFGAARRIGGSMLKAASLSGAAGGSTYGFIHGAASGKSPEEIAIDTSIGFGGGAAAGMLFALGLRGINPAAALGDVELTPLVTRAQTLDDEVARRVGVPKEGTYTNAYDPNVVKPDGRSPADFLDIARRGVGKSGASDVKVPPVTEADVLAGSIERGQATTPRGNVVEPAPRRAQTTDRGLEEIVREQAGIEPPIGLTRETAPVVPERVPGAAGTPEPNVAGEVIPEQPVPLELQSQAEAVQRAMSRPEVPGAGAPTQVPPGGPGAPEPGIVGTGPTLEPPIASVLPEAAPAARQVGEALEPAERFGVAGALPERAGQGAPPTRQAEALPGLERQPLPGQVAARAVEQQRIAQGTQALQGPDTGYTYNADFTEYTGGGKVVGVMSENVPISGPGDPAVDAAVRRMSDQAASLLERFGDNAKIGVFQLDEATASVDLNVVVDDAAKAVEIGKQTGQNAVWDADAGELIQTGLSGESPNLSVTQAADILERELGPSQRLAPGVVAATPEELAVAKAVPIAEDPGAGRPHQIDVFADQMIETASARIKARNQGKLSAFVDPADVADAAIIGAGYMLRGASKFADWSALMVQKFGDGVKPHLQRLFAESQSTFNARRSVGNDGVRLLADDYMRTSGLGPTGMPQKTAKLDEPLMRRIANAYDRLPKLRDTPQVRNSYARFAEEVDAQYQSILDAGYAIEFVDKDPYPNSAAMLKDLSKKRLRVFKTKEAPHALLTAEQNDKFRAVHDFFGHGKEGFQFGPEGEFNAWREHGAMFSNKAVPAMSTETLGQNAWVNFNKGLKPGTPLRDRPFATQKAALLPEPLWKSLISERATGSAGLSAGKTRATGDTKLAQVGKSLTRGIRPAKTPRAQMGRAEADLRTGLQEHLAERPESQVWYSRSQGKADELMIGEMPQLEDAGNMGLFKLVIGGLSRGSNPEMNLASASTLMDRFLETGRLPFVTREGKELGRFGGRDFVKKAHALIDDFNGDLTSMTRHLMEPGESGEKRAVEIFGPKVGRFFANLMGDLEEVTVDIWVRRWWGRINNDLFAPNGALIEAPKSEKEAELIRSTIKRLADEHNMSPAEMQSVIWDREKLLWRNAGAQDSGDMDFAQAAELVIRNRNKRTGEVGSRLDRGVQSELFDAPPAKAAAAPGTAVAATQETGLQTVEMTGPVQQRFQQWMSEVDAFRTEGKKTTFAGAAGPTTDMMRIRGDELVDELLRSGEPQEVLSAAKAFHEALKKEWGQLQRQRNHAKIFGDREIRGEAVQLQAIMGMVNARMRTGLKKLTGAAEDAFPAIDDREEVLVSLANQGLAEKQMLARADGLMKGLLGKNKKPSTPEQIGENPFWVAPGGEIIVENFGMHPISAKRAIEAIGETVPKQIGRQHGAIHMMEVSGFIRGQGQFGAVNFELVGRPTARQRMIMGDIIKLRGFGGGQLFDQAGEPGAFATAWGDFLRSLDDSPSVSYDEWSKFTMNDVGRK